MTNLKIKTALAAVTLAAATLAMPLSAHAGDYNRKCSDTSNGVLGAVIGGTVGAAIGDGVAGRGDSTEAGILGAVIGGIAGAAIGDSASDCENDKRQANRGYTTTTHYPAQTQRGVTVRTVGHNTRTYGNSRNHNQRGYTQTRSYNQRYNNDPLFRIDREIEDLRRERAYLKDERRRSRGYRPGIERRLDRVAHRLDQLKRERKRVKRYTDNRRNDYRRTVRHGY